MIIPMIILMMICLLKNAGMKDNDFKLICLINNIFLFEIKYYLLINMSIEFNTLRVNYINKYVQLN